MTVTQLDYAVQQMLRHCKTLDGFGKEEQARAIRMALRSAVEWSQEDFDRADDEGPCGRGSPNCYWCQR